MSDTSQIYFEPLGYVDQSQRELPSSPLLTDDQIDQVSAAIHEFYRR